MGTTSGARQHSGQEAVSIMRCSRDCVGLASCPAQRLRMRAGTRSGLVSQRPAGTAMHCSTVGQATAAWSSRLWAHSVWEWRHRRGSLLPANVSAKRLAFLLVGLKCRLGFVFHNFLCLLPPQLGSGPETTHSLGSKSGAEGVRRTPHPTLRTER